MAEQNKYIDFLTTSLSIPPSWKFEAYKIQIEKKLSEIHYLIDIRKTQKYETVLFKIDQFYEELDKLLDFEFIKTNLVGGGEQEEFFIGAENNILEKLNEEIITLVFDHIQYGEFRSVKRNTVNTKMMINELQLSTFSAAQRNKFKEIFDEQEIIIVLKLMSKIHFTALFRKIDPIELFKNFYNFWNVDVSDLFKKEYFEVHKLSSAFEYFSNNHYEDIVPLVYTYRVGRATHEFCSLFDEKVLAEKCMTLTMPLQTVLPVHEILLEFLEKTLEAYEKNNALTETCMAQRENISTLIQVIGSNFQNKKSPVSKTSQFRSMFAAIYELKKLKNNDYSMMSLFDDLLGLLRNLGIPYNDNKASNIRERKISIYSRMEFLSHKSKASTVDSQNNTHNKTGPKPIRPLLDMTEMYTLTGDSLRKKLNKKAEFKMPL